MIWPRMNAKDANRNRKTKSHHGDTETRRKTNGKTPKNRVSRLSSMIWSTRSGSGFHNRLAIGVARDFTSDCLLQRRWRRSGFDFDAEDAVAVHLQDGVTAAVEFKALAALGAFAQLRHDEVGQGFKAFFARQKDVVLGFQVAQIEAAVEHHGA